MARDSRFNVAPRYTGGSPALVDERTARRVAEEEQQAYHRSMLGYYGAEWTVRAQEQGLAGIVEERKETRGAWKVRDLLTGETFLRPFRPRAGDRVEFTWRPDGQKYTGLLLQGGKIRPAGLLGGQYLRASDCDDLRVLPKPIPPESF